MSEITTTIFEQASRKALRFECAKGSLPTELLWQLPLTSANGVSLDSLAIGVNRELRELEQDSFVATKPNPVKAELSLKLDILKHIIGVKVAERNEAAAKTERAAEKQKLLAALEQRQNAELAALPAEELQKRIAAL